MYIFSITEGHGWFFQPVIEFKSLEREREVLFTKRSEELEVETQSLPVQEMQWHGPMSTLGLA